MEMKRLSATQNVEKLIGAGILTLTEGQGRSSRPGRPPNVFVAKEILDILEATQAPAP